MDAAASRYNSCGSDAWISEGTESKYPREGKNSYVKPSEIGSTGFVIFFSLVEMRNFENMTS